MSLTRRQRARISDLTSEHWNLLEALAAEVDEDADDVLIVESDADRGRMKTLSKCGLAELVEEPGRRTGWTITEDGLAVLNVERPVEH